MSYQVLARKWRPRDFNTLVGQEHVVRTLTHALEQNRLHHAYLFTGTRGVGKTTIARILAKCFNCEKSMGAQPCNKCRTCEAIDAGRFVDLIEVDAASRTKVEDTRELLDNVPYAPTDGRYKVYLIDEVHMLSGHSFNALLKTLEEPPPHIKFLLATTDPQKLPITVLSRCLQFHLKNLLPEKITEHLHFILTEEKISFENDALKLLGRAACGSLRDALSLLDQAIAYGRGQIKTEEMREMLGTIEPRALFDILTALANNDANALLTTLYHLADQAADFSQILENLLTQLHQIALLQMLPSAPLDQDNTEQLRAFAKQFTAEEIQLYYQIGITGRRDLPYAPSMKMGLEMTLLRMLAFRPSDTQTIDSQKLSQTASTSVSASTIKNAPEFKNWETLLPQLNLIGPARALANHCTLAKFTTEEIVLLLDAHQAPLLNDKQKQRISQAIIDYFKKPIKVTIQITNTALTTPAAIEKQTQEKRQAQASQIISEDPHVKAILETFNGTIVPDSTKATSK